MWDVGVDNLLDRARSRLLIVIISIFIAYFILIIRLFEISYGYSKPQSYNNRAVFASGWHPNRLDIVDRNGVLLAVDVPTASVYANPKQIRDIDQVAQFLSIAIDMDCKLLGELLHQNKKSFVWLKRHLVPKEQQKILELGLPGIYMKSDAKRIYPHNSLFAHILGYTDTDGNGLAGVERYFDNFLLNKDVKDKALQLSIDTRLQYLMHSILSEYMHKHKAFGGVSLLMEVDTGEILSAVSLPDFDINKPSSGRPNEVFNRFSLGLYEMGSVFKSFAIASALDIGAVELNSEFYIGDSFKIADRTIRDYKTNIGVMSVDEIFLRSSNIGTVLITMQMNPNDQYAYLNKLGFFQQTSLELNEKASPIVPKRDKWNVVSRATVSYGHGISVTPIHLLEGIAAVIGGGVLHQATLLQGKKNQSFHRVFAESTSESMKYLFSLAVKRGTGMRALTPGYEIGGKTGSADKIVDGTYSKDSSIVSFAGVFPIDDPKYVLLVMVDDPKKTCNEDRITGGYLAAPIASRMIEKIAPILNVSPL
ncbi:cell division protein FtsI (penicillin-binding protein 3) [Candidatus Xenohaliotis californiensis]|uniref:Cell division protein FtsI (Penicillin-binding protein 3) n=1 Tax=Candidatus Xenohaliotis californiensis TaxID=84677 RepID=A0ABP0EV46_9RICK|nr:cell division protein FtsI (penicillin-binding protein 3) [Candidatus Xenohaliotis californiensis]